MEERMEQFTEFATVFGIKIIAALAIFIIGKWIVSLVSKGVEKGLQSSKVENTLAAFVRNLVYYIGLTFVFVAVLAKLGIQTTSFVAVLGAAGLAIGMALQGSLANFAAGVLIVLFRPYKVGDFISAAGTAGSVKEIQIFNTVLASPDNVKEIIPNAQVLGGSIKNFSANDTRRIDLVVGVSYSDDLKKVKQVLNDILANEAAVLKDPAPTVAVSELADSSVNLVVRPWVKASDYWPTFFGLTEKIKITLDENGISIPFPQRDVHMISEGQNVTAS